MNIRKKLVLTFTLLILLIFISVIGVISQFSNRSITANLELQLNNLSETILDEVEYNITNTAKDYTRSTAIQFENLYNIIKDNGSEDSTKSLILDLAQKSTIGKTGYVSIIDGDNKIVYHPTEKAGDKISVLNSWLSTSNNLDTVRYEYSGIQKVLTKVNIPDLNWQILVTGNIYEFKDLIDLSELAAFINKIKVGETGYPVITNERGIILTHKSNSLIGSDITDLEDANGNLFLDDLLTKSSGEYQYPWNEEDGSVKDKFLYFKKLELTGWYIMATGYVDDFFGTIKVIRNILLIGSGIGVLVSFIILFFISMSIVKPINTLSHSIREISEGDGDLTRTITTKSKDETGVMAGFFNSFISKLNLMMKDIKNSAKHTLEARDDLSAASEETAASLNQIGRSVHAINNQISSFGESVNITTKSVQSITNNIDNLNGEIENQNAMIEESIASITQMIASIDSVADITSKKQESIKSLVTTAKEGEEVIQDTMTSVSVVKAQLDDINELTNLISDIASSTNMLAMNAAIEAAHAGEAGKGFAVVADEIRKLAESSSDSSNKIKETVKRVTISINETSDYSIKSGNSFNLIDRGVTDVVGALNEITRSTQELQAGGQELLSAISSLMSVSQNVKDNSNSIKESLDLVNGAVSNTSQTTNGIVNAMSEVSSGTEDIISSMSSVTQNISLISEKAENLLRNVNRFKTA